MRSSQYSTLQNCTTITSTLSSSANLNRTPLVGATNKPMKHNYFLYCEAGSVGYIFNTHVGDT